jgi:enoyl-CoA hydratase/carnithine racemase/predicted GNAT family acetyltransferase
MVLRGLGRLSTRSTAAVVHRPLGHGAGKFELGTASLTYTSSKGAQGMMDVQHTGVPAEMRGQGVAEKLCEAAFAHAREQSLKILPTCSYVRERFVRANADIVGDIALRSLDAEVPGMQIETAWSGVATVRFTEARRRNPLGVSILGRLRTFLQARQAEWQQLGTPAEDTVAVRCIVFESSGPVFSSGHDLGDMSDKDGAGVRSVLEMCAEVNLLLAAVPQATVAAVAGRCLAAGTQLAASCDLVLAEKSTATFGLPGVHGGGYCHTPSVAVGARVSSPRQALELGLLGDEIGAEEAVRIGLANRAVDSNCWRRTVDSLGGKLAKSFNRNTAEGKRTFYRQVAASTPSESYEIATGSMVDMFLSDEWKAYSASFKSKPT